MATAVPYPMSRPAGQPRNACSCATTLQYVVELTYGSSMAVFGECPVPMMATYWLHDARMRRAAQS